MPQNHFVNMVDVVYRNIRIFKVIKTGEFRDKLEKDVSISCEYDPQGINLRILAGERACKQQKREGDDKEAKMMRAKKKKELWNSVCLASHAMVDVPTQQSIRMNFEEIIEN